VHGDQLSHEFVESRRHPPALSATDT
jgi:hypothetical protein